MSPESIFAQAVAGTILGIVLVALVITGINQLLEARRRRRDPQTFGELLRHLDTQLTEVQALIGEQLVEPLRKIIKGSELIIEDWREAIDEAQAHRARPGDGGRPEEPR